MQLIGEQPEPAANIAKTLIARTKLEIQDAAARSSLIQLIKTAVIYKLPRLSREEIQAMLEVNDIRETRVYQEALEEGREEERVRALTEKLATIPTLVARGMSPEEIAELYQLELSVVRQALKPN